MKILYRIQLIFLTIVFTAISCTDLEEEIFDGVAPEEGATGSADLLAIKKKMAEMYGGQSTSLGLDEMTTDSFAGPTRGGDWDDNAVLRQMHAHTWSPDNLWLRDFYNIALTGIYNCDLVLSDSDKSADHPKAKFLKSFFYFHMIDKFGQVPYREEGSALEDDPLVYTRAEAFDYAVDLLEGVIDDLPAKNATDASIVSQDAGNMLLAKYYLNKAVFLSNDGSTNYTFAEADMTKVTAALDKLTSTLNTVGANSSEKYWKNFAPSNNESPEIIFSVKNVLGENTFGENRYHWRMGMHYNQTPDGWNGPVIVGEYYDKFDSTDPRRQYSTPDIITNFGNPVGMQIGQVFAPGGTTKVKDRNGLDLIFTKDVSLVITDAEAIEAKGIRPMKYIPDNNNLDRPENDIVIFRSADADLMYAEALLRGGSGSGTAQNKLNAVRARVGLSNVTATLESIYDERARELWLESWRRNDMIRFGGKFLEGKELKPDTSDSKFLLFPIPADALLNPNISQNHGY